MFNLYTSCDKIESFYLFFKSANMSLLTYINNFHIVDTLFFSILYTCNILHGKVQYVSNF